MGFLSPFSSCSLFFMVLTLAIVHPSLSASECRAKYPPNKTPFTKKDKDLLQFPVNLEFLEAEFFLWGALGQGLDSVAPGLPQGGPPPVGGQKANLDTLTRNIITEFAYQEVGHLRALRDTVRLFPRPLLNLSAENFAKIIDDAFGFKLNPPFNPYRDSISYMIASYAIPYVGLTGYVGTNPFLQGYLSKRLLAGLLAVESGQDAVIRTYLYERANNVVQPYTHKVSDFTAKISGLRNRLAGCGNKDEGLIVPSNLGAENQTTSNILSANAYSSAYSRSAAEILRIVYGSGNEGVPGGFYPKGGDGKIAKKFLKKW